MLEQPFVFDGAAEPLLDEQCFDLFDRLLGAVVDLDHDLGDLRPVAIVNAPDDVQLALFRIDLEEVDLVDPVLSNHLRHGCQTALVGRATEPVCGELGDIFLHRVPCHRRLAAQGVPHYRLNGLAVLGFICMKPREHGGLLIEGQGRGLGPVRHTDVQGSDLRSVGLAVGLQELIHGGRRFTGVDRRVATATHHKQREQPDVGPDIHHRGSVRQADAMLQIAAIFEDLLVDIVRFIPVQMNDLQAIGQDASGPVAEALVRPFPGERHDPARIPRGPRLQPQEDDFDCVAARAERAARVQQLLKDLIVGRKFDVDRRAEMVTPEAQGILYRLSGEIRGDDEVGGRRFTGRVGAVQHAERDAGEIEVRRAGLVEHPNVADETLAIAFTLRKQYGVPPERIGEADVRYCDLLDRPQDERLPLLEDAGRQ